MYGSVCQKEDRSSEEEQDRVDRSADRMGGRGQVAEAPESEAVWLRAGDQRVEAAEPAEARSPRSSDASSPPSPTESVRCRPAADVLDILGLASSSTAPSGTSVDSRRLLNGLYNDHIANNNHNYNSNNNNSVTS